MWNLDGTPPVRVDATVLTRLPEDFPGRWETLLRSDLEISREQRYKVAELIARSIVPLK